MPKHGYSGDMQVCQYSNWRVAIHVNVIKFVLNTLIQYTIRSDELCFFYKIWFQFLKGDFFGFFLFMYDIQHCLICRPSDSTVSEDDGIEPRTVGCQTT